MPIRAFKIGSYISVIVIALIMWFPQRHAIGLDLRNDTLQASVFGICTLLWMVTRAGRLRADPYFDYQSGIWSISRRRIDLNIAAIALELTTLAACLELGQWMLTDRHAAFGDFFINAISIIGISSLLYLLVALSWRTSIGKRLIQWITTLD